MRQLAWLFLVMFVVSCSSGSRDKQNLPNDTTDTLETDSSAVESIEPLAPDISQEDDTRTEWQNPELVLQRLGSLQGKVVADLGAGSGYFTFKLAQRAEKVIALDIDPRALEYIKEQMELVGDWSKNIEPRLTPADVPNLLDEEADIVLIVNTYCFIPNKLEYLPRVRQGMKAGGKLTIVDFKTGSLPVGPADDYKLAPGKVANMLKSAGFRNVTVDNSSLQYQYIVTATK